MRSYWLKILLGAGAIFAVGMVGVALVRSGVAKINHVVEGSGPITIPLGIIPFVLGGERLGNLDHVTLHREAPNRVAGVELEVDLGDSLLAEGLSECQLAANFDSDGNGQGINIKAKPGAGEETFYCVPADSIPENFVPFGSATFQPGDIEVPLLLTTDMVRELQSLDFGNDSASANDSVPEIRGPNADSIRAEVDRELQKVDSQLQAAGVTRARGDSSRASSGRFSDSIRAEARKRKAETAEEQ